MPVQELADKPQKITEETLKISFLNSNTTATFGHFGCVFDFSPRTFAHGLYSLTMLHYHESPQLTRYRASIEPYALAFHQVVKFLSLRLEGK